MDITEANVMDITEEDAMDITEEDVMDITEVEIVTDVQVMDGDVVFKFLIKTRSVFPDLYILNIFVCSKFTFVFKTRVCVLFNWINDTSALQQ